MSRWILIPAAGLAWSGLGAPSLLSRFASDLPCRVTAAMLRGSVPQGRVQGPLRPPDEWMSIHVAEIGHRGPVSSGAPITDPMEPPRIVPHEPCSK
jgi:hypothetical protein